MLNKYNISQEGEDKFYVLQTGIARYECKQTTLSADKGP